MRSVVVISALVLLIIVEFCSPLVAASSSSSSSSTTSQLKFSRKESKQQQSNHIASNNGTSGDIDPPPLIFYVNAQVGSDDTGGGTEQNPWMTLQKGIQEVTTAHVGSALFLIAGRFTTVRDVNLDLKQAAGNNFTFASWNTTQRAVVDCQKTATFISSSDGVSLILKDFDVVRCLGTKDGGAIQASNILSLHLDNMLFAENKSPGRGGAVFLSGGRFSIRNSNFVSNDASTACGAISLESSPKTEISQSSFLFNTAASSGGSICFSGSNVLLETVNVTGNIAEKGGAFYCASSNVTLTSAVSLFNNSGVSGGGTEWDCPLNNINNINNNNLIDSKNNNNDNGDSSCNIISPLLGFNSRLCNLNFPPILTDASATNVARGWNISTLRANEVQGGVNSTMMHVVDGDDGPLLETLRYELIPYDSGLNVTLLFSSEVDPQLGPYVMRFSLIELVATTKGAPGGRDFFPIRLRGFTWRDVTMVRRAPIMGKGEVAFFVLETTDNILRIEFALSSSPVLIIGFGKSSPELSQMRFSIGDFSGPCQSLSLTAHALITTKFTQLFDVAFNVSSGSGFFAWGQQANLFNSSAATTVENSDPEVVQVPSGGFSYLPTSGFTVSEVFFQFSNVTERELPLQWHAELGYNVGVHTIVGVSILQLALFLGPRLFLFATGAQRCQQLLLLPKMVASVYPPMVKNKIAVSVVLAFFPMCLLIFHLAAGDTITSLQVFEWMVEMCAWLFSTWVLYLEHSRAMQQTWIPLKTWWVLAFYAESMSLYTRLSTVADLDIMFFPYLLQYVCYISMLLMALLHTSSSFEYSQLLRGGRIERVGKQDKGAVFVAVTLAMFTGQLVYGLAVLILPNYAQSHGITRSELGLVVGCYAVAILVSSPLFAFLSRQYGRRNMLLGGLSGLSVATVMFAFSDSLWSLMLARVAQGLAASANFTAGQAVLADTFPQERLGTVLGTAAGWAGLGLLLGPPLGGFLFELGGYALPFLIGAALSFVDVLVVALLMEDRKVEDRPAKLGDLWRTKVPIIIGVIILGSGSMTMMEPTLPLFIQQKFKVHLSTIGLLFGAGVSVYGISSPIGGWLSDRFGRIRITSIGLVLLGISLPLLTVPQTLFGEGCALAFMGMASALAVVATLPELAQEVQALGSNSYEEVYSLFNTAYAFGNIVGPIGGLFLIDVIDITPTYTLFGLLVIVYVLPLNLWKYKASDLNLVVSNEERQSLLGEDIDDQLEIDQTSGGEPGMPMA